MLAGYIRHKKVSGEMLVCPLKSNCGTVIFSGYSRFFGVPVELLGLVYYTAVAAIYGVFIGFPGSLPSFVIFLIFVSTILAFLFSLYLTFIQAFALKQWCTWCLVSAGLCTIIFLLAIFAAPYDPIAKLAEYRRLILGLHIFAVAIGLGGATIVDIFFSKFLKDFKISEQESETLNVLSQVIWFGLGLAILTGLGLFLPDPERLLASPKFLVKMIVVAVILINGLFLNLLISPRLVQISFGKHHQHQSGELMRLKKFAFALGAVSITSWYSAFVLGMLKTSPLTFWPLLSVYVFIVFMAVLGSQIVERAIAKKSAL